MPIMTEKKQEYTLSPLSLYVIYSFYNVNVKFVMDLFGYATSSYNFVWYMNDVLDCLSFLSIIKTLARQVNMIDKSS